MIRAAIFDVDGLIIDTETPDYLCWKEIYARCGVSLSAEEYTVQVGVSSGPPHPGVELARRCSQPLDPDALNREHRERYLAMVDAGFGPLPGFPALLDALVAAGLARAVASTARRDWVHSILGRLGVAGAFQAIVTGDDAPRGKPHPDVYLLAAGRLGLPPGECLALEDSAPGVQAARAAGMRCIAAPNFLTRLQDLSAADPVLDSLEQVTLELIRGE